MHQLAKCQRDGLVRRSVERWHLVHDALGVLPVSNSEQSFQQTQFLVVWGLRGHNEMHSGSQCLDVEADNLANLPLYRSGLKIGREKTKVRHLVILLFLLVLVFVLVFTFL